MLKMTNINNEMDGRGQGANWPFIHLLSERIGLDKEINALDFLKSMCCIMRLIRQYAPLFQSKVYHF